MLFRSEGSVEVNRAPKYSSISFAIWPSSSNHAPVSSSKPAIKFLLLHWLALQWKYFVFWSPSFNQLVLDLCFPHAFFHLFKFLNTRSKFLYKPKSSAVSIRLLSVFQLFKDALQSVSNMPKSVIVPHLKPLLTQSNVLVKIPHQGRPLNLLPGSLNNTLTRTIF